MIATGFLLAILGGVLITSALAKLPAPSSGTAFLEAVGMPTRVTPIVLLSGLLAELTIGAALVTTSAVQIVSVAALLLTSTFVVLHLVARHRGVTVRCGCFGRLEVGGSVRVDLLRAFLLAAFALSATIIALAAPPPNRMFVGNLLGMFVGIGGVVASANIVSAWETLRETRSQYRKGVLG